MAKATAAGLAATLGAETGTDDVYIMLTNEATGEVIAADTVLVDLPGGGLGIQPYTSTGVELEDGQAAAV